MAKFVLISAVAILFALSIAAPSEKLSIKIPKECQDSQYCSIRPEGYDKIERAVNRILSPHMIQNAEDRMGSVPTTERIETNNDNCPSIRSRESYYTAKQDNSTVIDIIIQSKRLRQTIEVVTCESDKIKDKASNKQCFENLGLSYFRLSTTCVETIANRSLLVFDPDKKQIMEKSYNFTVCCSCQITNVN